MGPQGPHLFRKAQALSKDAAGLRNLECPLLAPSFGLLWLGAQVYQVVARGFYQWVM